MLVPAPSWLHRIHKSHVSHNNKAGEDLLRAKTPGLVIHTRPGIKKYKSDLKIRTDQGIPKPHLKSMKSIFPDSFRSHKYIQAGSYFGGFDFNSSSVYIPSHIILSEPEQNSIRSFCSD